MPQNIFVAAFSCVPRFPCNPFPCFSRTISIASSVLLLIFYCTKSQILRTSPEEPGDLLLDFRVSSKFHIFCGRLRFIFAFVFY